MACVSGFIKCNILPRREIFGVKIPWFGGVDKRRKILPRVYKMYGEEDKPAITRAVQNNCKFSLINSCYRFRSITPKLTNECTFRIVRQPSDGLSSWLLCYLPTYLSKSLQFIAPTYFGGQNALGKSRNRDLPPLCCCCVWKEKFSNQWRAPRSAVLNWGFHSMELWINGLVYGSLMEFCRIINWYTV